MTRFLLNRFLRLRTVPLFAVVAACLTFAAHDSMAQTVAPAGVAVGGTDSAVTDVVDGGAADEPADSVAADPFTITDIEVDVTADNAVAAREKAFAEAQVKAFTALAERLMSEDDFKNFTAPDAADISTMINDFEVTKEQLSAVRYIGTYTFRFNGDYIRDHFRVQGISYTEMSSRPLLILPFYQVGAKNVLWSEDNPWLDAWRRLEKTGGLVPVSVPLGDIRDVASIGDDEALTYQPAGLSDMLDRYNTHDAIILIAGAADGGGLEILVYRTDLGSPDYVTTLNIQPDETADAADPGAMFDRGVAGVRELLRREWKQQTALPAAGADMTAQNDMMNVRVPFSTMQQWIETRDALRRVPGMGDVHILSVTPREARVELVFQGGEDRLRLALGQADLVLSAPPANADPYAAPARDLYLKKYKVMTP